MLQHPLVSNAVGAGETEQEPEAASGLFGERIELARAFTSDLVASGEELGLLGPLEYPRIWSRHVINCVLVAPLLKADRVGDIGSGAGLPGLVLAIARPDAHLVLIEPMERRADWLRREARKLALDNVDVLRVRAESAGTNLSLSQLTARAVTSLSRLIAMAAPLVESGGELIFLKGRKLEEEISLASQSIRRHNLSKVEILLLGEGITAEPTRVFRATVD